MQKILLLIACIATLCACGSSQPKEQEESKMLDASTIVLKGKHANMFCVANPYRVSLVKTDDAWQVRAKVTIKNKKTYNQLADKNKYECEMSGIYGNLLSSNDVELSSLNVPSEDWDMLLAEDVNAQQDIAMKTYNYEHYPYEKAKEIYDKVAAIQLSGIELQEAENDSFLSDEDVQDVMEDVQKILETEGQMINALQQMF